MTIEQESGIEFDFRNSPSPVKKHDVALAQGGEGNTCWKGVDFRVEDANDWLWVEVKSWDPQRITPRRRGGNQRSFVSKMRSEVFGLELRAKFLGTGAFLAWTGNFVSNDVLYVILLQPPRSLDKALLGTFAQRIRSAFPRQNQWTSRLDFVVVDLDKWNAIFPHFPARII